jgi:crotonobetainyl-CoA:carnitine CoA-transferase CaiB-like acyl-CoA transferase
MVESVFHMHPFAVQGPSATGGKARLRRNGRHFASVPPAGTYRGPEGWLVLQALDRQWDRLCDAAEDIDLWTDNRFTTAEDRARHRQELLEGWIQTFPSDEPLLGHLVDHRLPAAPVVDPADAHELPFFRERGAMRELDDPVLGHCGYLGSGCIQRAAGWRRRAAGAVPRPAQLGGAPQAAEV